MKVIIQAGGLGSRMNELTRNKPKGLIPIQYRPILFHLFQKWPGEEFIIIADYKFDVIDRYLSTFARNVNYVLIKAERKGNAAALKQAAALIPEQEPFIVIWSDLILADSFEEAFAVCVREAESGDAVLLSPACASWGMFPNYEVRGKLFKELVNRLEDTK